MAGRQSWDAQLSEGWFANLAFEISLEIMATERCELSAEGSLPAGFGDPPTRLGGPSFVWRFSSLAPSWPLSGF